MTISLRGSATGLTGGTTTGLAFTLPTGHTANDLLAALIGTKPYTLSVSSGTLTTDGWTQRSQGANGTTANGLDSGSVWASIWTKVHDGSESNPTGTLSGTPSPRMSGMIAFQSTRTGSGWSIASTNGSDATETGTTFDVTGAADPGFTVGDWVLVLVVHNTDAASHTSPALSIPGCTVANLTQQLGTTATNAGNDGEMYAYTADITVGSSTAAPQFTATLPTGDSDGQVIFVRIREPQDRTGAVVGATPTTTGTSLGTAARQGTVTGGATVTGSATGTAAQDSNDKTGTVTGALPTTSGITAGAKATTGTVAGAITVTGDIVGDEHHTGSATGTMPAVSGTAAGTAARVGTAAGTASVVGSTAGTAARAGSATGTVAVTGTIDTQPTPTPTPTPEPTPGGGGYLLEFAPRRPVRKPRPVERKSGRVSGVVSTATCTITGRYGAAGRVHGTTVALTCTARGARAAEGRALNDLHVPTVQVVGADTGARDVEYLALYAELRRQQDDHDLLMLL